MAIDDERKKRVIDALTRARLDAVICCSASEVLLLTGYWPVMAASVAVFTAEGKVEVVLPEDELDLAQKTSAAVTIPYKPTELDRLTNPVRALARPLGTLTGKLGLARARIGVRLQQGLQPASYVVSNIFRSSLIDLLLELHPKVKCVGFDDKLETLKARKTTKELEMMRMAAKVASSGFAQATRCIRPGLREVEVAASLQRAFDTSIEACSVQRSYGFFFCMSGPNSALASAAYARSRQRTIEEGDLVMIHANTCADGYWTDITRTYTAGTAPVEQHDSMRSAIKEAREKALRTISSGTFARDVDESARSVMAEHGFGAAFRHATGHGVGFAAANANGLPRIHPHSTDVLEVGMTFNIEPAAYFDGYGGMRHCDVVAVTPYGASVLTNL